MKRASGSATRFFFKNAGYSYDPKTQTALQGRWQTARELASSEAHALRLGWSCEWEWDDQPWDGDGDAPKEVLGCVLKNERGEVLASLWGIGDPSREYRRVVEAELAMEAHAEIVDSTLAAI